MKRLAIIASALVFLVVALAASAPFIVSTDLAKRQIANQITLWTGRAVSFRGEPVVSVYPYLTVSLRGLTLANSSALGPEPFMAVDTLEAKLRLLPLIFGRIEIAEFRLVRPRINLEVDATGHPNWLMRRGAVATEAAETDAAKAPAASGPKPPNLNIALGHFIVSDGIIVYDDRSAKRRDVATAVNIDFRWPGTLKPANGSGSLVWRGEPVEFNATVNAPLALLAGGTSPMRFALSSKPVRIAFTGNAQELDDLQVEGDTTVTTPSVRHAIEWLGIPMGPGASLGPGSIAGKMNWAGASISFANASVELDGNTGEGALAVSYARGRPTFQGTLDFATLDLSPYLEAVKAELDTVGPWPMAPVSLPMVASCDLDLRLSTDELVVGDTKMGHAAGAAAIRNGEVTIDVGDAQFYGGHLRATLAAKLERGTLVGTAETRLDGVPLKPALAGFAGLGGFDGLGNAEIDLATKGRSWGELAEALTGSARFNVADGTLDGIELTDMVRRMTAPEPHGFVPGDAGTTSFTTLAGTLRLADGALSTDDLRAAGKDFTVDVAGMTSLFSRSLDAKGTLHVADETSGGSTAIPFLIAGSWHQPMLLPARQRSVSGEAHRVPAEFN